jgi:membrane fusion protein, multidrug efflux system
MSTKTLVAMVLAVALGTTACGKGDAEERTKTEPFAVKIGKENTVTVKTDTITTGPVISGVLSAERSATVRAEVGGQVLSVRAEVGQSVRRGQVLGQIEDRTLRDAVVAAQSAVKSEQAALETARRELERASALVRGGAIAQREVETVETAVTAAESRLAEASSRLVSARKALADATITSPLTGVVSARPVNAGDIVAPGAELFTVIDPSSMRLEASVPSESLGALRVGAPVTFEVRGYPNQTFDGRIERISPAADPATRQVSIYVAIPNKAGRLVAGLFAEGRVAAASSRGLVVPISAIDETGGGTSVVRVRGGKAERVTVTTGLRDEPSERIEVRSGLNEGDVLLLGAARAVTPGTPVQVNQETGDGKQETGGGKQESGTGR